MARFSPHHRRAFLAMLAASKDEFGAAWAKRMGWVFSGKCDEPNLSAFAILHGGKIIAAFATRREVEALVLYFILIGKEHQGKGIGTRIVKLAEKQARAQGAKFLRLDVYTGKPVISFYRKLGFKVGGRVRHYEEENDDQTFLYKKV